MKNHEYSKFPPFSLFTAVLRDRPRAALLYAQLWDKLDEDSNIMIVDKDDVSNLYNTTPTLFKNNLSLLQQMELIKFKSLDKFYKIQLKKSNDK